jgi:paraquat-inducible protein B
VVKPVAYGSGYRIHNPWQRAPDGLGVFLDSKGLRVVSDGSELALRGLELGVVVDIRLQKQFQKVYCVCLVWRCGIVKIGG